MNAVNLTGRLTRDAELRQTTTGVNVCTFVLAVKRPFTGGKETDFLTCVAWNKTAEAVSFHTHKGDMVGVTGHIYTRKYQKKGEDFERTATEISVSQVEFLSSPKPTTQGTTAPKTTETASNDGFEDLDGQEDDLPF